jgi:hypothetical protein
MKSDTSSAPAEKAELRRAPEAPRRPWSRPRLLSSETFTKAALACCGFYDGPIQIGTEGSSGDGLPDCLA